MNLVELHTELRHSTEITELAKDVAAQLASRNVAPLDWTEQYARSVTTSDDLATTYQALLDHVTALIGQTDLTDDSSIRGIERYVRLHVALRNMQARPDLGTTQFTAHVIAELLLEHTPGIDAYVESLDDIDLIETLGLSYHHRYKLVDVSARTGFDLRKNGLILSADHMVYTHQFLRRQYCDNFTDLPALLRDCIDDGLAVSLRIDPLRELTHPKYYVDSSLEKVHWRGKPFSLDLLSNQTGNEVVTFHGPEDPTSSSEFDLENPVSMTIFRSSMMANSQRQLMIEEFSPARDPWTPEKRPPGFGTKWCIQKFGHFVYDQQAGVINHLDGAARVFSIEEYDRIAESVAQYADPGAHIGDRHKLFLVEGAMSLERAQQLLYEFFRRNPYLAEYFSKS